MTQISFISKLYESHKNCIFVGSLGNISKDLQKIDDGTNHIVPIKGAMGGAIGVGIGIAISQPKQVFVLIGDGSFLMKAGSMAAVLKEYRFSYKHNLKIYILNNNSYQSCGGQKTNFNSFKPFLKEHKELFEIIDLC